MYCSEYLWKYLKIHTDNGDISDQEAQGRLNLEMRGTGDATIVSDATGKTMVEGQAQSVYGRNMDELLAAYHAGDQAEFARIVTDQLLADEEVEAGKGSGR